MFTALGGDVTLSFTHFAPFLDFCAPAMERVGVFSLLVQGSFEVFFFFFFSG